jgi:hypothetical protein
MFSNRQIVRLLLLLLLLLSQLSLNAHDTFD